ncbi:MAG: DNA damage-inducible protein D [Flavobacteriales bacterium]|jgi:DNA-damage-inducible protein D
MKKELITALFEQFESAKQQNDSIEYWSARDMQGILGYAQWKNFEKVIEKAKTACENAGAEVKNHFADFGKMVDIGSGVSREINDVALTRYACYLVAQNGDATKSEIAFAQTYFAVQTRKQEIIEQRLLDVARVSAREKLSKSEKKLSGILYERGVDEKGFALIRSKGDQVLFGGFNTQMMKKKLGVPETKPLADHLSTLAIKAKDFANELTSHNVVEKDLKGVGKISEEHIENNRAVRKMLGERGVKPENLPAGEDTQKLKRKLASDDKKLLKDMQKTPKKKK